MGSRLDSFLARLWREEQGQAMVEYALLAGAIAIGLIVSLKLLGGAFDSSFKHQAHALGRAR